MITYVYALNLGGYRFVITSHKEVGVIFIACIFPGSFAPQISQGTRETRASAHQLRTRTQIKLRFKRARREVRCAKVARVGRKRHTQPLPITSRSLLDWECHPPTDSDAAAEEAE